MSGDMVMKNIGGEKHKGYLLAIRRFKAAKRG
jgi:hypothetical protein